MVHARLVVLRTVAPLLLFFSAVPFRAAAGAFSDLTPPADASALHRLPEPGVSAELSGERLFQQLHEQTEPDFLPSGHDYLTAKKFMFSKGDNIGCDDAPGVIEFYSQVCVRGSSPHGADYKERGDQNGDGIVDKEGMNAEHGWPQGYFDKALPMKSDLHHVFPSFITPNSARANLKYDLVEKPAYSTFNGSKMDSEAFEPADSVKGDVARAMLYFVVRYYDRKIRSGMDYRDFWMDRVPLFLEWNRKDPPDAVERRRNELIAGFQGNRNPFVDDPSLADRIGAKVFASH